MTKTADDTEIKGVGLGKDSEWSEERSQVSVCEGLRQGGAKGDECKDTRSSFSCLMEDRQS
jgi:hypothetical protein